MSLRERLTKGKAIRLLDLQFNGGWVPSLGAPVDFSASNGAEQAGIDWHQIEALTRTTLERGTTAYLATGVTADTNLLCRNFERVAEFSQRSSLGNNCLGIHGECFFSGEDGYRGAHPREHCLKNGDEALERYRKLRNAVGENLKMITVGADIPGIEQLISEARGHGVVVFLGVGKLNCV